MAESVQADSRDAAKVAAVIAIIAVVLNVLFLWLSGKYFADRAIMHGPTSDAEVTSVRIAFAAFTGITALSLTAAIRMPRLVGHTIPVLAGITSVISGIVAARAGIHVVLPAALVLVGGLLKLLAWKSYEGKRAGWAFLVGMCAMLAIVMLFGATKVRGAVGIGLWYAMIIPALLGVATAALGMIRSDYRES